MGLRELKIADARAWVEKYNDPNLTGKSPTWDWAIVRLRFMFELIDELQAGKPPQQVDSELCPADQSGHLMAFQGLWDSINGKHCPWESDPWVWVVGFKRVTP